MTSPEPEHDENEHNRMNEELLSMSTHLYMSDPLFHSRCHIALNAANAACVRTNGHPMDRDQYAIAMQATAIGLVLAKVSDEDISETVDHGKVLVSMMEFQRARDYAVEQMHAKDDES